MNAEEHIAKIRHDLDTQGMHFAFDSYDNFRQVFPQEPFPEDLRAVESHLQVGKAAYSKARRFFEKREQVEAMLENKRFGKLEAKIANSLALDPFCAPALAAEASMLIIRGDQELAVEKLREAVRGEPDHSPSLFQLAMILARAGLRDEMLENLRNTINGAAMRREATRYNQLCLELEEFGEFHDDAALLELCDPLPKNASLRRLFAPLTRGGFYETYEIGLEQLQETSQERLAVLDAIHMALTSIVDDLKEHGDDNLELHGDGEHDLEFFKAELVRIEGLTGPVAQRPCTVIGRRFLSLR